MDELEEILMGGQTFSWTRKDGFYEAVLNEHVYRVSSEADFQSDPYLFRYFDGEADYAEMRRRIASKDELLAEAVAKFPNLRILRQDPWIVTISFILSQNNNIGRIKGIHDRLCRQYGHEVEAGCFSFPSAKELEKATAEELRALGTGFRDRYILDAVRKQDLLQTIPELSYGVAMDRLMEIKGIGKKVASCILLFGFHRMEAFPIDVWMKKILATYYPGKDASWFAPDAALCQQYLFSYARFLDSKDGFFSS